MQALRLLNTTLGCSAFALTIPSYRIDEPVLPAIPNDSFLFQRYDFADVVYAPHSNLNM